MPSLQIDNATQHKAQAARSGSEVYHAQSFVGIWHVLIVRGGLCFPRIVGTAEDPKTEADVLREYPDSERVDALSYGG